MPDPAPNPVAELFAAEPSSASIPIACGAPSGDASDVFIRGGACNLGKVGDDATIPSAANEPAKLCQGNASVEVGGIPVAGQGYAVLGVKGTPGQIDPTTTEPSVLVPEWLDWTSAAVAGTLDGAADATGEMVKQGQTEVQALRDAVRAGGTKSEQVTKVLELSKAREALGKAQSLAKAAPYVKGVGLGIGLLTGTGEVVDAANKDGVTGAVIETAKQGTEMGLAAGCTAAAAKGLVAGPKGALAVGILCALGAKVVVDTVEEKGKELYQLQQEAWAAQAKAAPWQTIGPGALGNYVRSGGTYIGPPF